MQKYAGTHWPVGNLGGLHLGSLHSNRNGRLVACWWWSTFKSKTASPMNPRSTRIKNTPKNLLHSPSRFSSARVFAMIYRGGNAKFNACDGFGVWARTHSVCVWDSDSLPRRRSACCRPEQHFKSRQAAQSTTVSQFSHRQR